MKQKGGISMKFQYIIKDNQYVVKDDEDNRYKVYQMEGPQLQALLDRYLSLLASEHDLKYAREYIEQMFFSEYTTLIDGALINSAIQLLVKCFTNSGGKGRSQLNHKKVFDIFAQSTGRKSYLTQYLDFYNIRRRSLAHDDVDYKDNIIGITIDTQECQPVEITCIRVRRRFLYEQNAEILKEMILIALEFINNQKKQIENKLIKHYDENILEISEHKILDCQGIELTNYW